MKSVAGNTQKCSHMFSQTIHYNFSYCSVYIESTSYNTLKLYLRSIHKSDEGFYTCEAYILGMKFEHKAEVMIFGNYFKLSTVSKCSHNADILLSCCPKTK